MRKWIVLMALLLVVAFSGLAQAITLSGDAQLHIIQDGSYWGPLHYSLDGQARTSYSGRFHTFLTQEEKTIDTYSYCIDPRQVFYWNAPFKVELAPAEKNFAAAAWLVYNFDPFNGQNQLGGIDRNVIAALQLAVWSTVDEGFGYNYELNGNDIDTLYKTMMGALEEADYSFSSGLFASAISGTRQDQLVAAPVPEPATMLLMGIGLLGLGAVGRKRLK